MTNNDEGLQLHLLKMDARNVGISPSEIQSILLKYGPAVLKLVLDALKEGFSWGFIIEALTTLGPLVLTSFVQARKQARQSAEILKTLPKEELFEDVPVPVTLAHEDHEISLLSPRKPTLKKAKAIKTIFDGENVDDVVPVTPTSGVSNLVLTLLVDLLQREGPQLAQLLIDQLVKLLQQDNTVKAKFLAALDDANTRRPV
jgi:hypothetical protein